MCVVSRAVCRRQAKFLGIVAAMVLLAVNDLRAQEVDLTLPRYVLQQGGLTVALFVMGYFYRRDLLNSNQEKQNTVTMLVKIVEQNTEAKVQLIGVVETLTVELRELRHKVNG